MSSIAIPQGFSLQVDSAAPGEGVRYAFILETLVNLAEAAVMLSYPEKLLALMLADKIQPVAATLVQYIGVCMIAITVPLAFGCLKTPTAIESRRLTYWMYVIVEVAGISIFHYHAALGGEKVGLTPEALRFIANQLSVPLALRLIPLVGKPDWMGKCKVVEEKKTK